MPTNTVNTGSEKKQVAGFIEDLVHPHKNAIKSLRLAILAIDSRIDEEVKWNAPSFKLDDHFATFKLYPPKNIQIVLHRGAKQKALDKPFSLNDPNGLGNWKAPARCVVEVESSERALLLQGDIIDLVKQWISQL
jgi:hypothetical protein